MANNIGTATSNENSSPPKDDEDEYIQIKEHFLKLLAEEKPQESKYYDEKGKFDQDGFIREEIVNNDEIDIDIPANYKTHQFISYSIENSEKILEALLIMEEEEWIYKPVLNRLDTQTGKDHHHYYYSKTKMMVDDRMIETIIKKYVDGGLDKQELKQAIKKEQLQMEKKRDIKLVNVKNEETLGFIGNETEMTIKIKEKMKTIDDKVFYLIGQDKYKVVNLKTFKNDNGGNSTQIGGVSQPDDIINDVKIKPAKQLHALFKFEYAFTNSLKDVKELDKLVQESIEEAINQKLGTVKDTDKKSRQLELNFKYLDVQTTSKDNKLAISFNNFFTEKGHDNRAFMMTKGVAGWDKGGLQELIIKNLSKKLETQGFNLTYGENQVKRLKLEKDIDKLVNTEKNKSINAIETKYKESSKKEIIHEKTKNDEVQNDTINKELFDRYKDNEDIQKIEKTIQGLKTELEKIQATIKDYKSKRDDADLEEVIVIYDKKISEEQGIVDQKQSELKTEVDKLNSKLKTLQQEESKQVQSEKQDKEDVQEDTSKTKQVKHISFLASIRKIDDIKELETKISKIEKSIKQLNETMGLDLDEKTIQGLKNKTLELEEQKELITLEIEDRQEKITIEKLENDIETLQDDVQSKENEIETLTNEIEELKPFKEQVPILKSEIAEKVKIIETLTNETKQQKQEIENFKSQLQSKENEIETLTNEIEELKPFKEQVPILKGEIAEKVKIIETLTNETKQQKQVIGTLQTDNFQLSMKIQQIEPLQTQISELKRELEKANNTTNALRDSLNSKKQYSKSLPPLTDSSNIDKTLQRAENLSKTTSSKAEEEIEDTNKKDNDDGHRQ